MRFCDKSFKIDFEGNFSVEWIEPERYRGSSLIVDLLIQTQVQLCSIWLEHVPIYKYATIDTIVKLSTSSHFELRLIPELVSQQQRVQSLSDSTAEGTVEIVGLKEARIP